MVTAIVMDDACDKPIVATGYSAEAPKTNQFTSYMVMLYRAFNLLGFSQENVNYVWGGCLAIRKDDFKALKVEDVWADGGYSDDMAIGRLVHNAGGKVVAPLQNMFENRITCSHFKR